MTSRWVLLVVVSGASAAWSADCSGVGGMVHASSACARVALSTAKVEALSTRVPPETSLTCGKQLSAAPYTLELRCLGSRRTRTFVDVVITEGKRRRVARVATHRGFFDTVVAWIHRAGDALDVTVDFVTYD